MIWKLVLIQPVQPVYLDHRSFQHGETESCLSILQTCRLISQEAAHIFYQYNHLGVKARCHYQDSTDGQMREIPIEQISQAYFVPLRQAYPTCMAVKKLVHIQCATEILSSLLLSLSPLRLASIRNLTIKLKIGPCIVEGAREQEKFTNSAYRMLASKCFHLRGLTLILLDLPHMLFDTWCNSREYLARLNPGALEQIRGLEETHVKWSAGGYPHGDHVADEGYEMDGKVADELRSAWKRPRELESPNADGGGAGECGAL